MPIFTCWLEDEGERHSEEIAADDHYEAAEKYAENQDMYSEGFENERIVCARDAAGGLKKFEVVAEAMVNYEAYEICEGE